MIELTADELFEIERALLAEKFRLMEQKRTFGKIGADNLVNDTENQIESSDKLCEKIASFRVEQMMKDLNKRWGKNEKL